MRIFRLILYPFLLLAVLLVMAEALIPLSADRLTSATLTLTGVRTESDVLWLGFADHVPCRVPRTESIEALLTPHAAGSDWQVWTVHHPGRMDDGYDVIHALSTADGTPLYTVAESEALRQQELPQKLLICCVPAIVLIILFIAELRRKKPLKEVTK